ncbi:hypothetical protein X777_08298, partial [Ooceraea biroi]
CCTLNIARRVLILEFRVGAEEESFPLTHPPLCYNPLMSLCGKVFKAVKHWLWSIAINYQSALSSVTQCV